MKRSKIQRDLLSWKMKNEMAPLFHMSAGACGPEQQWVPGIISKITWSTIECTVGADNFHNSCKGLCYTVENAIDS